MSRFVIVSFAALGWAFYELSGGPDFEPPERPEPALEVATAQQAESASPSTTTLRVSAKPVLAPRLSPREKREQQAEARRLERQKQLARQERLAKEAAESRRDVLDRGLTGGLGLFDSTLDTTTITFSADDSGLTQLVTTTETNELIETVEDDFVGFTEPKPDLREVIATRVNMRDGPGTVYPIVARLTIGNEVLVLDDSGNGWLRLRVAEGQQTGWVAASLISKKPR
ncbi:MAG: SH3 domain-containing protein [Paracoccaceae bacterium]|jgi:uncharacterized protein YgiM (DUF1202 family)